MVKNPYKKGKAKIEKFPFLYIEKGAGGKINP
jgi:hypothetical protein